MPTNTIDQTENVNDQNETTTAELDAEQNQIENSVEESAPENDEADDLLSFDDDDDFLDELDESTDEVENDDALRNEEEEIDAEGTDAAESAKSKTGKSNAKEEKVLTPADEEAQFYDAVTTAALDRVKAITGQDYDEFDPKHKVILTRESQKIAAIFENKRTAEAEAHQIVKAGGENFAKFLAEANDNLTVKQQRAMIEAESRGDFSLSLNFIKDVHKKFTGGDKAKAKAEEINARSAANSAPSRFGKKEPPKTMPSGTGAAAPRRDKDDDMLSFEDLGMD